jgi:pimeloyl-ACP methyl ester carboxylesterase
MCSFHFLRVLSALGALLVLGLGESTVHGQGRGQKVAFKSYDKVDLNGTFYPSTGEGKRSPVVLLLHKLGGNSQEEGWDKLAKALQEKGMAVLSFDFRGHGDSVAVDPDFWKLPTNPRGVKGVGQPKISYKDFAPTYWPMLVNDVAAAKFFIDDKLNNSEECNVSELVLVGAEDGGAIAALWMAAEWSRKKPIYKYDALFMRDVIVGEAPESPGSDVAAAVFLSLRSNLGGGPARGIHTWFTARTAVDGQPVCYKVPMCFFHGQEDKDGTKLAKALHDSVINKGNKLKTTFRVEMPKTKLAGSELLKGDMGTEDFIARYITEKVMKERPMAIWTKRDTTTCPLHLVRIDILSKLGVLLPGA